MCVPPVHMRVFMPTREYIYPRICVRVKASPHGALFSASASRLRLRFDVTSGAGTKRSVFWRIPAYLEEPDILRPRVASRAASRRQQPMNRRVH